MHGAIEYTFMHRVGNDQTRTGDEVGWDALLQHIHHQDA